MEIIKNKNDKLAKKNYLILLIEGSLISAGRSFIDASSVASVFIDIFTGNLQLAGIVSSIRGFVAVMMQTFTGSYMLTKKNQPRLIFWGKLLSTISLFVMPVILLAGVSGYAAAVIFMIVYSLIWIIDGSIIVPWLLLGVRTLPHRIRSTVLSYRTFFGGILTFALGYLIRWFLKHPDMTDPERFAWIFGIGAVIMMGSSFFFLGMRDVDKPNLPKRKPIGEVFKKIPQLLKANRLYSDYIIIRVLAYFSTASAWFIILFGRRILGLGNAATSTLILVQIAGGLAGGLIWSWVNHRLGTKTTMISMRALVLLKMALAIPCFLNPGIGWVFIIAMAFLNGLTINLFFGDSNYMLDIIGYESDSDNYVVTNSLIAIPFSLINIAAGAVAEHFGFIPLFITSAVASLVAILMAPRLLSSRQIDELHVTQRLDNEDRTS